MNWKSIAVRLGGVILVGVMVAFGAGSDEVSGMIMARSGDTMVVNTSNGKVTVVLNEATRVKDDKGLFGLDKQEFADTVLIPGLKVRVEGSSDSEGKFIAKTITVDGDDLETSQMVEAGLHPTANQVAENVVAIENHQRALAAHEEKISTNKQDIAAHQQAIAEHTQKIEQNMTATQENTERFNQLGDYDVKAQATVRFKVNSSTISTEDEEQLKKLAETAAGLSGYIVEVKGFADATGTAAMNEKLSEDRAKAVIGYLMRECNLPVWRIVAPGAMGEFQPAATNETAAGRAENRRVEVKILVNKGISGG
ncbi:MAG: OmpA family protein [Acidobacteriota bacterium]|nr:OmpA family protein [Acidobacteriota bacterium]